MLNVKAVLNIKQRHIDNREPESTNSCPIALALMEQFDATEVSVDSDEIEFRINGHLFDFKKVPNQICRFIERFDEGKKVRPTKLVLKL